jgi:hypothetical protein
MSRVYGEGAERWGIEMSQEKAPPQERKRGFPNRFGEGWIRRGGKKLAELKAQIPSQREGFDDLLSHSTMRLGLDGR